MHDIKWIREHPGTFDAGLKKRGLAAMSAELLALDAQKRQGQTRSQELQAKKNALAKDAGMAKAKGQDASALFTEAKTVGDELKALEAELSGEDVLSKRLAEIPNLLDERVPEGADESGNEQIKIEGAKPEFAFAPKDHVDLGEALGLMDFEAAAKMSGARFVVLKGPLARMERALSQFMLDQHTGSYGYQEVSPPILVKDNALFGTGQLPKFDNGFETTNGYYLIPTAEVSITNIVADQILDAASLPIRMTACTPCFRSEAGSAGRDTRGMIRQHQFIKVELVSITEPKASEAEHERMLGAAENILQKLGLHYRVMLLCAGDTGFGSRKTYDIEVWLPGQGAYREISSCSNFGDFQARRLKTRYKAAGEKKTEFVHTLNGSGLAVGRTMVAILENYQRADGSIAVPDVLQPYMGGLRLISRN